MTLGNCLKLFKIKNNLEKANNRLTSNELTSKINTHDCCKSSQHIYTKEEDLNNVDVP